MISKEEFSTNITDMKNKIGDVESAKISEDALNLMSSYNSAIDRIDELENQVNSLNKDREDLLKTNGKLFQQIGFQKPVEESIVPKKEEMLLDINDIIDKKGNIKNG